MECGTELPVKKRFDKSMSWEMLSPVLVALPVSMVSGVAFYHWQPETLLRAFWGLVFLGSGWVTVANLFVFISVWPRWDINKGARNEVLYRKELKLRQQMIDDYKENPFASSPLSSPKVDVVIPQVDIRDKRIPSLEKLVQSCIFLFPDIRMPRVEVQDNHPTIVDALAWCDGEVVTYKRAWLDSNPHIHELVRVTKHELVHAWIIQKALPDNDVHGELFKAKAKEVGCYVEQRGF